MEVKSGPTESEILNTFKAIYTSLYRGIEETVRCEPNAALVRTILPLLWESARYMAANNSNGADESE